MRLTGLPDATNAVTGDVIDAAIKVHTKLGPGLLESTFRDCLAHELHRRGHVVEREMYLDLAYEDLVIRRAYRIDMRVDGSVLVELKATQALAKRDFAQLSTYLKLTGSRVGLLINFDAVPLKEGIHRVVR